VLITEDFVNEERYAKTFARGKFQFNKWGKLKIRQALQFKGLSDYCQRIALEEIGEEDYHQQVISLIQKKLDSLKKTDPWITKNKAAQYAIGKGYESEIVWKFVNELMES